MGAGATKAALPTGELWPRRRRCPGGGAGAAKHLPRHSSSDREDRPTAPAGNGAGHTTQHPPAAAPEPGPGCGTPTEAEPALRGHSGRGPRDRGRRPPGPRGPPADLRLQGLAGLHPGQVALPPPQVLHHDLPEPVLHVHLGRGDRRAPPLRRAVTRRLARATEPSRGPAASTSAAARALTAAPGRAEEPGRTRAATLWGEMHSGAFCIMTHCEPWPRERKTRMCAQV